MVLLALGWSGVSLLVATELPARMKMLLIPTAGKGEGVHEVAPVHPEHPKVQP